MPASSTDECAGLLALQGGFLSVTTRTNPLELLLPPLARGVERGDVIPFEITFEG